MAVETTPNRGARKPAANKTARAQPQPQTPPQAQLKRTSSPALIDPERRRALIAEAAYFRAERRGFIAGHEAEDWLAAEAEVDTALTVGVLPRGTPAVQ